MTLAALDSGLLYQSRIIITVLICQSQLAVEE